MVIKMPVKKIGYEYIFIQKLDIKYIPVRKMDIKYPLVTYNLKV